MKIIARILVILLAALVVVGATLAVTNSSTSAQAAQNGQRHQRGDGNFNPGQRPGGERDREGDGGGSAFGWLIRLIPISIIVFVVVMLERFWGKIFKPRAAPARIQ